MAEDPKNDPQNEPAGKPDDNAKMKRLEAELAEMKKQVAEKDKQLEALSKSLEGAKTAEDIEKAVSEAKAEAQRQAEEIKKASTAREKRLHIDNALIKAGCIDTDALVSHINMEEVEVASDGHIAGLDVKKLSESYGYLFQASTSNIHSAGTPGGSGKVMTKEEIRQIKDPAKRREAIAQNMDLYK